MNHLKHADSRFVRIKETPAEFLRQYGITETPGLDAYLATSIPPPAFSFRSDMSPAKAQGAAGTCTSFGVVSCLDYFHGRIDLSEAHLTHQAEKAFGDCQAGLALAHAMQAAKDPGVVDENWWGYDPTQICWANPPDVSNQPKYAFRDIATVFNIPRPIAITRMLKELYTGRRPDFSAPQNPNPIALIAAVLSSRRPVVVSVPVWFRSSAHLDAGWDFGPDIHMPTPVNLELWLKEFVFKGQPLPSQAQVDSGTPQIPPNVDGWHCIALCGYDNTLGSFEFKNSWDTWWGDNGFGRIPYQYISQYADIAMYGWV